MVTNKGGGQSSGEMAGASGLEEGPNGTLPQQSTLEKQCETEGDHLASLERK